MTDLLDRLVVPLADEGDARTTARGLRRYLDDDHPTELVAVYVVERAAGTIDKVSTEQRKEAAEATFEVFRAALDGRADLVETEVLVGPDVAESIFETARERDATAIAFTPRKGGRLIRLLTGDVALSLVTKTDRPVVVLPDVTDSPGDLGGPDGPDSPPDPDGADGEQV